jgi:hypothetical protein
MLRAVLPPVDPELAPITPGTVVELVPEAMVGAVVNSLLQATYLGCSGG